MSSLVLEFNLSKREQDVLGLLVRGKQRKAMSQALFVSEETIKSHAHSIYCKLGLHSQKEVKALFNERCSQIELEARQSDLK